MTAVTARAFANVALIKYFGKRDAVLNLPAAPSLSVTLSPLETVTTVETLPPGSADDVFLNGTVAPTPFAARVCRFLDLIRERSGFPGPLRVSTTNRLPTAAGLASSASGFAALAAAAARLTGLSLTEAELSALARRGSGSAARSVTGGLCVWQRGEKDDGSDSFARTIASPGDWDLRLIAGIADPGEKPVGSTAAMELTRTTSPYYSAWIDSAATAVSEAMDAVSRKDLAQLGALAEASALSMHAAAMAARPGIVYFNGTTVEALHLVRRMRQEGIGAWFTCDAGPQPKVLCHACDAPAVVSRLSRLPGIRATIECRPADGAAVLEVTP